MAQVDVTSETGKHTGEITALVFDNEHVYSGGEDGVINVWDKDLKFVREIPIHKDYPVLALAVNSQNHLYSSGRDGSLRFFRSPWRNNNNDILLQTVMDDVTTLYCVDNILYSGDDKGIVTKWYHNQVGCQYNTLEEVRSMAIEGTTLYTVRDSDVTVTDISSGMMSYTTKGSFEGRTPVVLVGGDDVAHKKFVACSTRDGKGLALYHADGQFKNVWTAKDAHEMIINAIVAAGDTIYTAGYEGKVKKWVNLENGAKNVETIDVGKCVNALCIGPNNSIYAGDSSGVIRRLQFAA